MTTRPVVSVATRSDGTVVVQPHGQLDADATVRLRQVLVQAIRRQRPHRLVLDLSGVAELDPINVGTIAASCVLGDDHRVAVFLDNATGVVATRLAAAGVPRQRLRYCAIPGTAVFSR